MLQTLTAHYLRVFILIKCADTEQHLAAKAAIPIFFNMLHGKGKIWSKVEHNRGIKEGKNGVGPA